jgi:hypothetical protein
MFLGEYDSDGNLIPADKPWWETAATSVATAYQLQQLSNVNAQRAAQGLPPIDMSALAPQVNVSLPPAQVQMLIMLGLGVIAAIYFSRKGN